MLRVQAPLLLSKSLPLIPQILLLHPHSNTVFYNHSSGTTPTSLWPFSWETECISLLCSKLTIFLMGSGHWGFFAFYPFPTHQILCHKSPKHKTGNSQMLPVRTDWRKPLNYFIGQKRRQRTLHSYIYPHTHTVFIPGKAKMADAYPG